MKHVGKAISIFGVVFFLPLCLSNKNEKPSLFRVQPQWLLSKEPILQGNNFQPNSFFLIVHYQTLGCMYTTDPKILGLQSIFSKYYTAKLVSMSTGKAWG